MQHHGSQTHLHCSIVQMYLKTWELQKFQPHIRDGSMYMRSLAKIPVLIMHSATREAQSEAMVCNWVEFLASFGASVLDEDGNPIMQYSGSNRCYTADGMITLEHMLRKELPHMLRQSHSRYSRRAKLSHAVHGPVHGIHSTIAEQSEVAGKVGMTMLPVYNEGDTAHSCLGGLDLAVNTYIDDEHKEAAKTFIKWLCF